MAPNSTPDVNTGGSSGDDGLDPETMCAPDF